MNAFLLGLTSGLAVLTLTAYRRVSPTWLKGLLIAVGGLIISSYFIQAADISLHERIDRLLMGLHVIGLTLPCVFAIDQLIRHPAITPKKLLQWYSPFALLCLMVGFVVSNPDNLFAAINSSVTVWLWLMVLHGLFIIGLVTVCVLLFRKIPSPSIRTALSGVTLGQIAVALTAFAALWRLPDWSLFIAESIAWVTLWYAYDTSVAS